MQKTTSTKYGVAEGEKLIGDLFDDVDTAKRHLAFVTDTQAQLGIERDVRLVTVEATTTYSRPKVYREDVPAEETPDTKDTDTNEPS